MHIKIEYVKDRVIKRYIPIKTAPGLAEEKYFRELAAYEGFARLDTDYVPRLLAHVDERFSLEIELAGTALNTWIAEVPESDWEPVIRQLLEIDRDLYQKRINYLYSSPADVLVDGDGRVRIVDFEYTEFGRRYEHLLLAAMSHDHLRHAGEAGKRFDKIISNRLPHSYRYIWRRLCYSLFGRLGLLREQAIRVKL